MTEMTANRKLTTLVRASTGVRASAVKSHSVHQVARTIVGRRGIPNMHVAKARAATVPKSIRAAGLTKQYLASLDNA